MSIHGWVLRTVLLPGHNAIRGRRQIANWRQLCQSQWWPAERIREFQWKELGKLLDQAFAIPFYSRKYTGAGAQRGDIKGWEDFRRLPALSRQELNEYRDELRNPAYRGRQYQHATGGSSGVPTRFSVSMESYDWRTAATWRAYSWPGVGLGERSLYLWGAPVGTPPRWKQAKLTLYQRTMNQLVFNTMAQDLSLWERVYEGAVSFKPSLVVGYVSSLKEFARYLTERGLQMSGVKGIIAAAEPVFSSTRAEIEPALGAPLYNTYGSREFMSIAAECEQRDGLHVHAENLLVETESAGASEILVTDLHNYAMPFLRYRIGDAGILQEGTCVCGRGLPRLRSIEGRTMDVLRTADGRIVPGEFFPHVLKEIKEILEFQVEQRSIEEIVVRAVMTGSLSETSNRILTDEVAKAFGSSTRVVIEPVTEISRLASGKRRVTIGLRSGQ